MRRGIIGTIAAAGIFTVLAGATYAQGTENYPNRPIKVVVPAAAGDLEID